MISKMTYCQEHISLVDTVTDITSGIRLDLTVCEITGKLPKVIYPTTQTRERYS